MAYQFIHVELYSKNASKEKARRNKEKTYSASDVAAEQMRMEGHIGHVNLPGPPEIIFGIDPRMVVAEALASFDDEPKAIVQTKQGPKERANRGDIPIIMAGVASWPDGVDVLALMPDRRKLFEEWKACTLMFLKKEYGADLRSVVLHNDESHPHLHFTVACKRAVDVRKHHPGARAGGIGDAMRGLKGLQDNYFRAVSLHCGLARFGPRRKRCAGGEWRLQKDANEALALEMLKLGKRQQLIEQAERDANGMLANALGQAERIIAKAKADAQEMASEILRAAKYDAGNVLSSAKASLEVLIEANKEVEDTLAHLGAFIAPKALKQADKRVKAVLIAREVAKKRCNRLPRAGN
jgi:vacuolar-type H+-ATPase subunit H